MMSLSRSEKTAVRSQGARSRYGSGRGMYHLAAAVLVVAFFLMRLSDVGANPKGFYCDEAAFAYNASTSSPTVSSGGSRS